MSEIFSMVEGSFGKVVVIEINHDLVPRVHSELKFGYWLSGGQGRGRVGDQSVVYSESQAVAINRYQTHDLLLNDATEPVMLLKLYLHEAWFDEHFNHCGAPIGFQNAQLIHTDEMKSMCWQLAQKILFTKKSSPTLETDVIALLQTTLNSKVTEPNPSLNTGYRNKLDDRLNLALRSIHDHMTEPNLIERLPKMVGVSRSRLYELFKDELQSTPNLIWNCALLDNATKRIVEKQEDFANVSSQLGFSTAANFSRFFRGYVGVTPTTYRKGSYTLLTTRSDSNELE